MSGTGKTAQELEEHYRKAIEKNPEDVEAYGWFMTALYLQGSEKQDEFNEHLTKLWEKDKLFLYKVVGILSELLLENNRYEAAEQMVKYGLDLAPKFYYMYFLLGELYRRTERLDEALDAVNKAIELHPEFEILWLRLGDIYVDRKEYNKAEEAYKKAMSLNPEDKAVLQAWQKLVDLQKEGGIKGLDR
jgi:tetratricopeptide (TPR) repeat protein